MGTCTQWVKCGHNSNNFKDDTYWFDINKTNDS